MTNVTEFHEVLRIILGDNDPHGVYAYDTTTLDRGVKFVFRLGRGPEGYAWTESGETKGVTPALPDGNAFAMVAYEAALLLIGGEQGANSYRTRAISVTESGDRKRDLMHELRFKIHDIRNGDADFVTYQNLLTWMLSVDQGLGSHIEVEVDAPLSKVSIAGTGLSASVIV